MVNIVCSEHKRNIKVCRSVLVEEEIQQRMTESLNTSESLASSVQSFPQKKKVVKKKPKKTTKQSIQPFLCFEGPTTAYFQSNNEDEEYVKELSVFNADYDELDDFDMKSWSAFIV